MVAGFGRASAYCLGSTQSRPPALLRMSTAIADELTTGDFEGVKFARVSGTKGLGKYSIDAVIKKADMNSFLNEYKEEMKRRKVVFPGFRAGKLPPYVMGDVRKYLVCFGLETLLGQLCNLNKLQMCSEEGNEVPFGEDSYYEEIVKPDFRGYDFIKQRDAWREGTDFSFSAEFFAISEEEDEDEGSSSSSSSGSDRSGAVIDAEVVSPEEVKQD